MQIRRSLGSLAAYRIEELALETGEEALAGRVVVGIAKTRTRERVLRSALAPGGIGGGADTTHGPVGPRCQLVGCAVRAM